MGTLDLASLAVVGGEYGVIEHHQAVTVISAAAGTDAFVPPDGGPSVDRLPGLRFDCPDGAWTLAIRTAPTFSAAFDAGALVLRTRDGSWAKLAYEQAPDGRRMAVSVVTKETSDDANGPVFQTPALYLRACFTGKAHAFHVSADGKRWDLLRFFALPGSATAVDIIAQSPTGLGCEVRFDLASFVKGAPSDLRDGS
ncbi:MAG TPA: DUF1349 domain-containing protein [Tabrizicola sp.]|nr:DUF1349 domain-containing protein [Tabrizicola sp.]